MPRFGRLLLSGIFTCMVGSTASFGWSILLIWGGAISSFATIGRCPLIASTISCAPPPPPPPANLATGKVMGGMYALKSTGVTFETGFSATNVRAFSVRDRTSAITTVCMTNEIALDVLSRLKTSGSTANIGREAAGFCARLFGAFPPGGRDSRVGHAEVPASCAMRLELLVDSGMFKFGVGVVRSEERRVGK